MKKNSAADFYFRISIWTFLCLFLATAAAQFNSVMIMAFGSKTESFAVSSIQTIKTLQAQYASKHQGRFAPTFDELIKSVQLDERFAGQNPVVDGYVYSMKVEEPSQSKPAFYSINADPLSTPNADDSELRHFYCDSTLVTTKQIEENRPAKADDPSM